MPCWRSVRMPIRRRSVEPFSSGPMGSSTRASSRRRSSARSSRPAEREMVLAGRRPIRGADRRRYRAAAWSMDARLTGASAKVLAVAAEGLTAREMAARSGFASAPSRPTSAHLRQARGRQPARGGAHRGPLGSRQCRLARVDAQARTNNAPSSSCRSRASPGSRFGGTARDPSRSMRRSPARSTDRGPRFHPAPENATWP